MAFAFRCLQFLLPVLPVLATLDAGESLESTTLLELRKRSVKRPLLVIHAGLHKTGTTSLQLSMNTCNDWAGTVGVTSLVLEGQPKKVNHNFLVHFADSLGWELPLYKETLELRNESAYLRTWEKLRACEERHFAGLAPCRALLSSELFTEAQVPVWQSLFEKLPKWEVRVLIFHRYYPAWLLSLYGEYQRDYMVDTAHNPMSLLEFALEGPGAQLSPRRTLERIQEAFSVCKGGDSAQCSVQGASYDIFQHQGYDQYEYLVLNVTLDLQGKDFQAANRSLWEGCPQRVLTHASPPNLTLAVDIVRLLKNSHQARGCTSQFLLSASNPEVLELANKEILPVTCMDIGNLLADDSARWFENAHLTPPTYHKDSQFCQIKQQALTPEHWRVMHALTSACNDGSDMRIAKEKSTGEQGEQHASQAPAASKASHAWLKASPSIASIGDLSRASHLATEVDAGRSFFVQSPVHREAESPADSWQAMLSEQASSGASVGTFSTLGSRTSPPASGSGALPDGFLFSGKDHGDGASEGASEAVAFSERGFSVPVLSENPPTLTAAESTPRTLPGDKETLFGEAVEGSQNDLVLSASSGSGLEGLFGEGSSQLQISSYVSGYDGFDSRDLKNVKQVQLPQARGLNEYEKPGAQQAPKAWKAKPKKEAEPKAEKAEKARPRPIMATHSTHSTHPAASFSRPSEALGHTGTAQHKEHNELLDRLDGIPQQKPGLKGMAGVFSDEAARPVVRVMAAN